MEKIKKNAKKIIIAAAAAMLAVTVLVLYLLLGVLMPYYNVPNKNKTTKAKYDPSTGLVSKETYFALMNSKYSDKYTLGVNKAGEIVFRHPGKAFKAAKKEYKKVWKYGDKKLKLKHLSKTYYINYTDNSIVDLTVKANPELEEQAKIYQEILTIYSHSFNKHR